MDGRIFFYSANANGEIEWIGSAMIWLLLALSVANIMLIVLSARANHRRAIAPAGAATAMRELIAGGRVREASERCAREASDLGRVLEQALARAPQGGDAMTKAAEQAADELLAARLRGLERLNLLGQVAPMIGLFGTVYGMIVAFQGIVANGGAADPGLLAGGIGTALVTTFWGLVVAIPAMSAYAILRNRTIAFSDEALASSDEMIALLRPAAGGN
jgi:biopolymer transport protein ExbB